MKTHPLTFPRILAIGFILLCSAVAWLVLGSTLMLRTAQSDRELGDAVNQVWGSPLAQAHPVAWYLSPAGEQGRTEILPSASKVDVRLDYDPKSKGLLWYRTYAVQFQGLYEISNPTPIAQTIYVQFHLPTGGGELEDVAFKLGAGSEAVNVATPHDGTLVQAIVIPSHGTAPLKVSYRTRGRDSWTYQFNNSEHIRDFKMAVTTNFAEIDFPVGTSSPSVREAIGRRGWTLTWTYADVINPLPLGVAMPNVLNAGPVAARISNFAPVSLLFFFSVLLIIGAARGINLHPMNYFFLAAGCFAFQLLFAYLVDLVPVHISFVIAALVSLVLVCGYLHIIGGRRLSLLALPAQLSYMVLFSYSFFFDGISGLTITVGAIVTLAILMVASARIDWAERFTRKPAAPVADGV
jgi:hypothetical protein